MADSRTLWRKLRRQIQDLPVANALLLPVGGQLIDEIIRDMRTFGVPVEAPRIHEVLRARHPCQAAILEEFALVPVRDLILEWSDRWH